MWFISFMLTIGLSAGHNKHGKLITQAAAKAAPQQEHHYNTTIPLGQIPGSQSCLAKFRVRVKMAEIRNFNLGAVRAKTIIHCAIYFC